MNLTSIDWIIMLVYFAFVLGIGFVLKRRVKTSTDFFLAGRAIPAWVCGLAFISANLGAQEVIGMAASGAKYGISTSHFYWIGAIPAMVFVGIFMMPFYYGSRARSVPEYLRLRFDEKTRGLNAISFATMTVFSSGISMYAMARLIQTLHLLDAPFQRMSIPAQWIFHASIIFSAGIVLGYIFLGGLSSAIYNEVLQFFLIVAGFLPLVWLGLKNVGGWHGLTQKLPAGYTHSWVGMASPHTNRLGVEWFGLVMGLGFVLSFGYWCTDFLVVQRAMAANSMSAARRTPLIAAIPKMFFPFLVILHSQYVAALLPDRNSRPGTYRAAGQFHVGHGGERDCLQHRLDLRYLPVLHPAERQRRALPHDGAAGNGLWDRAFGGCSLRGDAFQQHHGHAATGLRLRERAVVRDFPAWHVLETRHRPRRIPGIDLGHNRRGTASRSYAARGRRRRN